MKIILCTGDSHTCGQGADNIMSRDKINDPKKIYVPNRFAHFIYSGRRAQPFLQRFYGSDKALGRT